MVHKAYKIVFSTEENYVLYVRYNKFVQSCQRLIWLLNNGVYANCPDYGRDQIIDGIVLGEEFYNTLKNFVGRYIKFDGEIDCFNIEFGFENKRCYVEFDNKITFDPMKFLFSSMNINEDYRKIVHDLVMCGIKDNNSDEMICENIESIDHAELNIIEEELNEEEKLDVY